MNSYEVELSNAIRRESWKDYNLFCKNISASNLSGMILHLFFGFIMFNFGFLSLLFNGPTGLITMCCGVGVWCIAFLYGRDSEEYNNLRSD